MVIIKKWDKIVNFQFFIFFSETKDLFKNVIAVYILNLMCKFNWID